MKTVITVLLFLFMMNAYVAQTNDYHSFPDSNASWREMAWLTNAVINQTNPYIIQNQHIIALGGDTIINGLHYQKLLQTGYQNCDHCTNTFITWDYYTDSLVGAIRQDTAMRKVYFIEPSNASESILYDFNLALGDTISNDVMIGTGGVVTAIDSILVGSDYRKRFKIDNRTGHIIEGIGSNYGLLNAMSWFIEQGSGLYCFHQNNITYYNTDTLANDSSFATHPNDCSLSAGIREFPAACSVTVFPNPANTILNIDKAISGASSVMQLIITDLLGKVVVHETFSNDRYQLSIVDLSKGIYFYEIKTYKSRERGKFVKE